MPTINLLNPSTHQLKVVLSPRAQEDCSNAAAAVQCTRARCGGRRARSTTASWRARIHARCCTSRPRWCMASRAARRSAPTPRAPLPDTHTHTHTHIISVPSGYFSCCTAISMPSGVYVVTHTHTHKVSAGSTCADAGAGMLTSCHQCSSQCNQNAGHEQIDHVPPTAPVQTMNVWRRDCKQLTLVSPSWFVCSTVE